MNPRTHHSVAATVLAIVASLFAAGVIWGTGAGNSKPTSAPASSAAALSA
jgi:hypothetical protein